MFLTGLCGNKTLLKALQILQKWQLMERYVAVSGTSRAHYHLKVAQGTYGVCGCLKYNMYIPE